MILAASDDEIFEAYRQVARLEGVFCEPSSAAGIAGLAKCVKSGALHPDGKSIVCVLTGHGLKDPDSAVEGIEKPLTVEAKFESLARVLGI